MTRQPQENITRTEFRDDRLHVRISEVGDALTLQMTDLDTGTEWGPSPLLSLDIHDHAERCNRAIRSYRIDTVESIAGGAHVTVTAPYYGISVGLWFRLRGGELSVLLPVPEVYERKPERYRLFVVDIMPRLMRAGSDSSILLPIAGGLECSPSNKPAMRDQFLIYLEQPRWLLTPLLPFAAVYGPEGGGLAVIATQCASDAQCRAGTDGNGAGWTGFAFSLRQHWPDPVDALNREFRFFPIPKNVSPPLFVAKRLRRHAIDDFGKAGIAERAKESPEIAYQLSACVLKISHGMENNGACLPTIEDRPISFLNWTTFAETQSVLRKLRDVGIPRLYTQSSGWNARGHDGWYPSRFPIDERLGGESGFREMLETGHSLGYQMNVHDNFQMNIPHAPNWDPECVIMDMFGEPLMRGWWAGGEEYGTWFQALPPERVTGHMQRVKNLGVRGMYYCDYMMAPLEVNYHPRHRGGRARHLEGQIQLLEEAKRIFGAVGTEYGTFPGLLACDNVTGGGARMRYSGADESWPIYSLVQGARPVPMVPLTMQGLTIMQADGGATWLNVMRAIAFGLLPKDQITVRPSGRHGIKVFSDEHAHAFKAMHELCIERFGHLIQLELTGCEVSPEQAVSSEFSDGTIVSADLKNGELRVNGKSIQRPHALPWPNPAK